MNFQVPQFIEVEDKIFGPLTFKQFAYLAGGAGLGFIEWAYLPFKFLAVLFIIPTVGLALALAFYKINNRPFISVMESAFYYWTRNKLYIWRQSQPEFKATKEIELSGTKSASLPKLSGSKLKDLAWSLDIQEKIK